MKPSVREIITATSMQLRIGALEIQGRSTRRHLARARQIAMYLSRQVGGYSLPKIGKEFGRDHTTIIHACKAVSRLLGDDKVVSDLIAIAAEATAYARSREAFERDMAQTLHAENGVRETVLVTIARRQPRPVRYPMPSARWTLTLYDRKVA